MRQLVGKLLAVLAEMANSQAKRMPARRKNTSHRRAGIGPDPTFNHHAEFDEVGNADQAAIGAMNELGVTGDFGLSGEDGSDRGRVQNHFGRPCLSYSNSAWSR